MLGFLPSGLGKKYGEFGKSNVLFVQLMPSVGQIFGWNKGLSD